MDLESRIAQLSPAKLALLEQKLRKDKAESPKPQPVAAWRQNYAPLSFSQERLWFLDQMEPDSSLYNLPAILPLRGPVNPDLVETSVRHIVARHSALRTRFVVEDDSPQQVIAEDGGGALDFSTVDLRGATAPSTPPQLSQAVNDEIWLPFNLATGPLLRVRLFLQRNDENFLLVVMHHIVSDGWSIQLFTREFRTLYEAARRGDVASLPAVQQYLDYSISQRQSLAGDRLATLLAYWRKQLDGAPSVIGLPLDRPRPARQSFHGALHPFSVPSSSLQNLRSLCREGGVVPFMVLLSAFDVLLFRYTNQSRIVVGTPIANRNRSELETVIGFFTNTLVLSSSVAPEMTFRELLAQVRDTTLGAYEHQELPFEKLVSELQPERSLSHNPLFQVMFTFQNLPGDKASGRETAPPPDPAATALSLDFKFSKFDLTLAMTETDEGLSAVFEYATDLFETGTIERMATHLVNVLESVLRHPDEPLAAFSFLPPSEQTLILEQWNATRRDWPDILPLHGRFERRAQAAPEAAAVKFRDAVLTYRELDRRADAVARLLRSRGVRTGSIVGICLPRSLEMVTGLLAILKAGAAYMPIEPDFPEGRVAYMLDDAQARHVLTLARCLPLLSQHEVDAIALDELELDMDAGGAAAPPIRLRPADLAYVLFTSGSTGQPKGVMVPHGAIDNRLQWMQEAYGLGPDDRVLQKTPYSFDVSVWEFFWTLSAGACLVVAEPERHKESLYLVDLIETEQVTCLHFVPSMLQLFLHEDLTGCHSMQRIICSGEALTVEQCRGLQALPGVSGHNLYGPTEAAVDVTHWDCDQGCDRYLSVPIGRPISNTQIYILNEQLQPAPIGVPGQLYIGGHNLAAGYLNKPELTARQFIPSPFAPGARLYKTGDLALFRSGGEIEYIGRIDSQVKLRGSRIELGEIESVLRQYPGVAEATVVVHRFGEHDDRLAAYVVPAGADKPLDIRAASAFIAKKLPSYMVPATITTIPELPLTANGKLDRKRLPAPTLARTAEPVGPVSDVEKELLAIWRKFLKADTLHTNDDFFALGGHSILATQVINRINGQYHLNVPVRLLFENPTVKALAKALSEVEDEAWIDESRMATAILASSSRRLLQTLDQLSEEQLDHFLRQHGADPALERFDDVASLLAWSRDVLAPPAGAPSPPPAAGSSAPSAHASSQPFISAYLKHYFDLAQTRAAIEGVRLRRPADRDELLARLQEQGSRIFESYAREMKAHLSADRNGDGPLSPPDMRECCGQLMSMAALAASITRI
jgi:surfactin family lipopeptide synthetase A